MNNLYYKIYPLWIQVHNSIRERGVKRTLLAILLFILRTIKEYPSNHRRKRLDLFFDRKFGTNTAGRVELDDLHIESNNKEFGFRYQGVLPDIFREMMSKLPIKYENFVFIDFGSGKGRALLLAAEYPFRRIIGIEFSLDLYSIALSNIKLYKNPMQKCFSLECEHKDVIQYSLPADNLICYLYNPFDEKVLSLVLDNIKKSLTEYPRELFVVYRHPAFDELLFNCGFLEKIISDEEYSIFQRKTI